MECIHFKFDFQKSTQAINYFVLKNHGEIDKLKVIKLIYFADRYHLRKYGRPTTNDDYYAMDYGPVNSGVKDIIDASEYADKTEKDYASLYLKQSEKVHNIKSIRGVDEKVLSNSDVDALEFAWSTFGEYDNFQLAEITHKYPDWKKHEETLKAMGGRVRMNYADFFEDQDVEKFDPCFSLSKNQKRERLELLKEYARVENLWE